MNNIMLNLNNSFHKIVNEILKQLQLYIIILLMANIKCFFLTEAIKLQFSIFESN